jgi:hypothetical protein
MAVECAECGAAYQGKYDDERYDNRWFYLVSHRLKVQGNIISVNGLTVESNLIG